MLQRTGQKITRSNTHIQSQIAFDVGTSRIDLALDEERTLNISMSNIR